MKLTQRQQEVVSLILQGKMVPGEYVGAIRGLVKAGLVTSLKTHQPVYPATPGGMVWHKHQQTATHVVYRVTLTADGRESLGVLF